MIFATFFCKVLCNSADFDCHCTNLIHSLLKEITRQVLSMIHSARPKVTPVANIAFCRYVFLDLRSARARAYVQTDGQYVRKQLSIPAVTLGWPSGSISKNTSLHFQLYTSLQSMPKYVVPDGTGKLVREARGGSLMGRSFGPSGPFLGPRTHSAMDLMRRGGNSTQGSEEELNSSEEEGPLARRRIMGGGNGGGGGANTQEDEGDESETSTLDRRR